MSKIDREWIAFEALKVVSRTILYQTLKNTFVIEREHPFRNPTKKELSKHSKLIRKQRRKSIGE